MKDDHPRRYVMAVPPGSTAWIGDALQRSFSCQSSLPASMQRLIEQLNRAH